uniref:Uncharacterized protein n=1 Tax=Meloidogyne enterolobii TaxID=390850 RepID=A0A6V7WD94_MELEN|nr:unnamed protein product [Meloidogyne enterolobii]
MTDWLEHLEVAKQTTLDLMEMSGPVSAFVAASLNKAFAKESKEYQAMMNLNRGMKNSFNNLDVNLQNIQGNVLDMFDISTYLNQVTMRIASLSLSVDYATNPVFSRSVPIKQAFINACVGENGPEQILMKISRITRLSCKSTSEEMEKLHSEALNLFSYIENYFQLEEKDYLDEYSKIRNKFLDGQYSLDYSTAEENLASVRDDIVEKLFKKKTVFLNEVFDLIREATSHNEQCILSSALTGNKEQTSAIQFMSEKIIADISKVINLALICANTTFIDPESIERYKERSVNHGIKIITFMKSWITKKLDLYWPNVMLTRAFEAIKDEEIQLINYNQSAERIGKELLKRGLPGFHFHVLITPYWLEGDEFLYGPICFNDTVSQCNKTTNFKKVNVISFRQRIEPHTHAISAHTWLEKNANNITRIISKHKNLKSLGTIIYYVYGAIGSLITKEGFSGFVFLFNKAWTWSGSWIDFGLFSQTSNTISGFGKVEYGVNNLLSAYRYNLFLFV